MDQETKTILSVARAFKNYIESEGVAKKTLNNLKYLSENDHLVNILFSKLQNGNQRIKAIFATYFMFLRDNISAELLSKIINNLYKYEIQIYDDYERKEVECTYCGGSGEDRCEECDGSGEVECGSCEGTKKEECYECDGSGAETCGECDGDGKVEEIVYSTPSGDVTIPCDLVITAIGYEATTIPGVKYESGKITNTDGRVAGSNMYVVGWAKRGPSGVIGTNKSDAAEVVKLLISDLKDAKTTGDIAELISEKHKIVDQAYWVRINGAEVAAGEARGKPRVKAVTVPDLLRLGQP